MLKKRVIFTLLFNQGHFVLSRNFRLQRVGDVKWLQNNYDFSQISFSIDELIVLDVTRGQRNTEAFCDVLKEVARGCFAPIAAGGGVRTVDHARQLLRSGSDKIVLNTPVFEDLSCVDAIAKEFGQQCVVGAVDVKRNAVGDYEVWVENGSRMLKGPAVTWLEKLGSDSVGEVYLNSINRDGTGQGYDFVILDLLPRDISQPVILAGGVGNAKHLAEGLADSRVDAVATAHLFNFVGDGLRQARNSLLAGGFDLPEWDLSLLERNFN